MNHVEVLWMNGACALYCGSTTLRLGSSEKPKGIYHDRPSVLPEVLLMDGKSWSRIKYKKEPATFLNFRAKNGRKIFCMCTFFTCLYLFVPFFTFLYFFVLFCTFLYLSVPFCTFWNLSTTSEKNIKSILLASLTKILPTHIDPKSVSA